MGLKDNFCFGQDNDHKHCARVTEEWILYSLPQRLNTPPPSPHVNPIEHLSAELKCFVYKHRPPTKEMLKNILMAEWNKISLNFIKKNLFLSIHNMLQEIICLR